MAPVPKAKALPKAPVTSPKAPVTAPQLPATRKLSASVVVLTREDPSVTATSGSVGGFVGSTNNPVRISLDSTGRPTCLDPAVLSKIP